MSRFICAFLTVATLLFFSVAVPEPVEAGYYGYRGYGRGVAVGPRGAVAWGPRGVAVGYRGYYGGYRGYGYRGYYRPYYGGYGYRWGGYRPYYGGYYGYRPYYGGYYSPAYYGGYYTPAYYGDGDGCVVRRYRVFDGWGSYVRRRVVCY